MKSNKYRYLVQGLKAIDAQIKRKCQQQINKEINNVNKVINNVDKTINNVNKTINQAVECFFQYKQVQIKLSMPFYNELLALHVDHKLQKIIQQLQQCMKLPSQMLGKRSSKILVSKSHQYCLKQCQQQDFTKFQQIFSDLQKQYINPNNYLIKIYNLFQVSYNIKGVKIVDRYLLMPNIGAKQQRRSRLFDVKGVLESRLVQIDDFQDFHFGKDQNFVHSQELAIIRNSLTIQTKQHIIQNLRLNMQFLTKHDIIDYSLLISIENINETQINQLKQKQINENYSIIKQYHTLLIQTKQIVVKIAIIDYFQVYNEKKKFQNKFKSLFKKQISSVQPEVYSKRFIKFLTKYLIE